MFVLLTKTKPAEKSTPDAPQRGQAARVDRGPEGGDDNTIRSRHDHAVISAGGVARCAGNTPGGKGTEKAQEGSARILPSA